MRKSSQGIKAKIRKSLLNRLNLKGFWRDFGLRRSAPEISLRGLPQSERSAPRGVLTNTDKKSIIHGDGSFFSLRFLGQLRRFKVKTASARSTLTTLLTPHKGRKMVTIMKTFMKKLCSLVGSDIRVAGVGLVVGLALAACGGGGSSNNGGVTPPVVAKGEITVSNCVVADGSSACDAGVVWKSSNALLPRVTVNGVSFSSLASGSGTFSISLGSVVVAVADGSTVLDSVTAFAGCGINSAAVLGVCQPVVTGYDKVLVGVRFGEPGIINLSSGTPWVAATNNTSYQTGVKKIGNGYLSEAPLADCRYLELVQATSDGDLHIVQHNLKTNTLTDYTDPAPAGYEVVRTGPSAWTIGVKWHNAAWGAHPFSYMTAWGQDADGSYAYTEASDNRILRKQTATGAQSVVYTSTDGGVFNVINSVTCHP